MHKMKKIIYPKYSVLSDYLIKTGIFVKGIMNETKKYGKKISDADKINEILSAVKENEPNFSFMDINSSDIKYYPESFKMCEMNSCGCFNTNWTCPPASPEASKLFSHIKQYKKAKVFNLKYKLADDYDWKSIESALNNFSKLCRIIQKELKKNIINAIVLGTGACSLCEKCSYPDELCRHPDLLVYPLEAAGIDAYSLLKYREGKDCVPGEREYVGIIAHN